MLPGQEDALGSKKSLMPQVFSQKSDEHGMQEDRRRRATPTTAAAPSAKAAASSGSPAQQPAAAQKPTPPAQAIIDRVHKESGGLYGGYVILGPDHDASEGDQIPPTNPGWRTQGVTASSLADAYAKAVTIAGLTKKANARVAIIILSGVWTENPLMVNTAGIDFVGIDSPVIAGKIIVGPVADTRFRDLDVYSADDFGGIVYQIYPGDTDARAWPAMMRSVRCFGAKIAFLSQRRIYAEHCEFWQTSRSDVSLEFAACKIEYLPMQAGWSIMKDCQLHAWHDDSAIMNYGDQPYGFALHARGSSAGTFAVNHGTGFDWYMIPNAGLLLDECEVYGSLLCEQWIVEHKGGHQHGGIPVVTRTGNIYLRMRGLPLFDSNNGYYGSQPAYVTFDGGAIHSEVIGQFVPWNGTYLNGVNPIAYPGAAYVAVRHLPHLFRYDGAAAQPFISVGCDAIVDVVNASTGCASASWASTGVITTTYGSCPTGVLGNRELYQI